MTMPKSYGNGLGTYKASETREFRIVKLTFKNIYELKSMKFENNLRHPVFGEVYGSHRTRLYQSDANSR